MHGGLAPRVQAKVRAVQLRARINGELQALGWEPVIDPIPRYAELAGETWRLRIWRGSGLTNWDRGSRLMSSTVWTFTPQ